MFGEFPSKSLHRIFASESYKDKVITALKQQGLLKTYYNDGIRGLRPTIRAKRLLLDDNPDRFSFYLGENSDVNHVRSDRNRRERLHRIAEATLTMKNIGVSVFRDERSAVFGQEANNCEQITHPAFFNSREVKETAYMFAKSKETRSVGILLTEQNAFITYSFGDSLIKWHNRSEMKIQAFTEDLLCLNRMPTQYTPQNIKGLILGDTMDLAYSILSSDKKNYRIIDDNYENLFYVTNDRNGETILRLLCDEEKRKSVDELLKRSFYPANPDSLYENDATTANGHPVLIAYCCDLARIKRFASAIALRDSYGILLCFDFQAGALRHYCGDSVEFRTINIEKVQKRFLC